MHRADERVAPAADHARLAAASPSLDGRCMHHRFRPEPRGARGWSPVGAGRSEVVERVVCHFDDVIGDELRPVARRDFGMLQAVLPLVHRPAGKIVGGKFGEYRLEVHLAIAERAIASGAVEPALVAAVDALFCGRIELGVLDVKHLDALVIRIDEAEIVEALLDEMAGVVIDVATRVSADRVEEHIEGVAVKDVFGRMDLEAEVDTVLLVFIEDGFPPTPLFRKALLDEPRRALRIWIEIGPCQRTGEADMLGETEATRNLCGLAHLVGRPKPPFLRIAADCRRTLAVEHQIISRVHRHHLALKMRRELTDRDADVGEVFP